MVASCDISGACLCRTSTGSPQPDCLWYFEDHRGTAPGDHPTAQVPGGTPQAPHPLFFMDFAELEARVLASGVDPDEFEPDDLNIFINGKEQTLMRTSRDYPPTVDSRYEHAASTSQRSGSAFENSRAFTSRRNRADFALYLFGAVCLGALAMALCFL